MKKGSVAVWILIVLLLVGGVGYYFYSRGTLRISIGPEKASEDTQLVGDDRDAHGCIGSAGYSWCEAKSKCLRVWEEPCDDSTPVPTVDEAALIKQKITEDLVAKRGESIRQLTITVSKISGNYATGGAAASGGGAMWLAAKTGGIWNLIWDGNGVIYCSVIAPFPDFPKSMVPECWDEVNNKNVVR